MTVEKLELSVTGSFSNLFLDYLSGKPELQNFYHRPPTLESFRSQIEEKHFDRQQRTLLTEALHKQYCQLHLSPQLRQNLELLQQENTYTVTTGHQLNIFTGPLYFIYKICTVINLCKRLGETYPDCHFVPVYWMASEDHDFAEINHFSLFGKTYEWQTQQQGAVGRFHPNGIGKVLEEMPDTIPLFEEAYGSCSTLADATRHYVNALFGNRGLLVLDADDASLKASFAQVIKDDLLHHTARKLVDDTSQRLDEMGYKTQVSARDINFFYLQEQLRERILEEDGQYGVLNTALRFSPEEMLAEAERHPERFSPNVILRPLYQEMILPNLSYVGGPAEIAYWLQLKPVFAYYQVPFPVLMPRNFALVINKTNSRKLQKIPVQLQDLFLNEQSLVSRFVEQNANGSISLEEEKAAVEEIYRHVREKVLAVDKGLEGFIGAETKKAMKNLSGIEKKLRKSEEQNQAVAVKHLSSLKEKLFPEGGLQERKENFLNFYINNPGFIDELLEYLDPLDYRFHILSETV